MEMNMADQLGTELKRMVLTNWGMVYDLQKRAEEVRQEVLSDTRSALVQAELAERYDGLVEEVRLEQTKSYWFVGLRKANDLRSYVQVEVKTDTPTLEVRVWTGFTGQGVKYAAVKAGVAAAARASQVGALQMGGSNVITVERFIVVEGAELEAVMSETVEEVERQLAVAVELYGIIARLKD